MTRQRPRGCKSDVCVPRNAPGMWEGPTAVGVMLRTPGGAAGEAGQDGGVAAHGVPRPLGQRVGAESLLCSWLRKNFSKAGLF